MLFAAHVCYLCLIDQGNDHQNGLTYHFEYSQLHSLHTHDFASAGMSHFYSFHSFLQNLWNGQVGLLVHYRFDQGQRCYSSLCLGFYYEKFCLDHRQIQTIISQILQYWYVQNDWYSEHMGLLDHLELFAWQQFNHLHSFVFLSSFSASLWNHLRHQQTDE